MASNRETARTPIMRQRLPQPQWVQQPTSNLSYICDGSSKQHLIQPPKPSCPIPTLITLMLVQLLYRSLSQQRYYQRERTIRDSKATTYSIRVSSLQRHSSKPGRPFVERDRQSQSISAQSGIMQREARQKADVFQIIVSDGSVLSPAIPL